jgi:predicted DNA-binding protein (MmcQ/YjbR family)
MNLAQAQHAILAQPHAVEDIPFGPGTLVYKVGGKMFALTPDAVAPGEHGSVALKVEPYLGDMLRATWPAITAAYHMNKRHWIDIRLDGSVPDDEILGLIRNSWRLVVNGLTKAQRAELGIEKQ